MRSFAYDVETLGKNKQTCPVLSIAGMEFDTDRFLSNPYTLEELVGACSYMKFNVEQQVSEYGRVIEKDTLDWWKMQGPTAFASQVAPSDDDQDLAAIKDFFYANYKYDMPTFTRGNTFDPVIVTGVYDQMNFDELVKWWNVRDFRSMFEGLSYGTDVNNKFMPGGIDESMIVAHDPRYDVAVDILRYQALVRAIS